MKPIPNIICVALAGLSLICFAFAPMAQAVTPPPDGGYPGQNTAEGFNALRTLTNGNFNTAVGWLSLSSNQGGFLNTGVGAGTLLRNIGDNSEPLNPKGVLNTAVGAGALLANTTGTGGTANGALALFFNTEGKGNTAVGASAMKDATGDPVSYNTAIGTEALRNTSGIFNTAIGEAALGIITAGNSNVAVGSSAGLSLDTGDNNIYIGADAGPTPHPSPIGADAGPTPTPTPVAESGTIRIGKSGTQAKAFIAGIRDVTTGNSDAVAVVIDSAGQLGTASSSGRFKKDIKSMDGTSEAILQLRPVRFLYKNDTKDTPQFGLIAEDVAAVNPDLVVRDKNGEIYTVRYEAVNAMLLNEFLKEHRRNEEQGVTIARLEKQVQALTAGLQKVSAELDLSRTAPQTVANSQ